MLEVPDLKVALDIVEEQLDWCPRRGRWVVVAVRVHRANPDHRYRSDHVWRPVNS